MNKPKGNRNTNLVPIVELNITGYNGLQNGSTFD